MNIRDAAEMWASTWARAWPRKDIDAIAALYAPTATYRALAFREPAHGLEGVRRYLRENFDVEEAIACWFGEPIVDDDRAAVEWWGSWIEGGQQLTLAGTSVLRFDTSGLVIDQRDYWNQSNQRIDPYAGW